MLVADHTLTDAEIKALPTTPQVILSMNAAKAAVFFGAELILNDTAGAYTNVSAGATDVLHIYGGTRLSGELPNDELLGLGTKQIGHLSDRNEPGFAVTLATRKGAHLELRCVNAGGDFTGGNAANTLRVIVFYRLIVTG